MSHTKNVPEQPDRDIHKKIKAKCYYGHEVAEIKIPESPGAWVRSDKIYQLGDWR